MSGRLGHDRLVIASHNPGKVREIAALLGPLGVQVLSAAEAGIAEPEETGTSFAENAELKARAAVEQAGLPALADDSGLAVLPLGGEPGIYSARWAGPEKDFRLAMEKVQAALGDGTDRRAEFVCALCVAWPGSEVRIYEGRIAGDLVWPPRGERGFGYDPIFVPEGYEITFGEMEPEEKHRISHRARAFEKLVADLFS